MVNVQTKNLYSLTLGTYVKVSLPANLLRNLDRAGGLDNYLLTCDDSVLDRGLRKVRGQIQAKQSQAAA